MSTPVSEKYRIFKTRYGFVAWQWASLLVAFGLLRLFLWFKFNRDDEHTSWMVVRAFLVGVHVDIVVATMLMLPFLAFMGCMPDRWHGRWPGRILLMGGAFLFWFGQIFSLAAEYFFFEEFQSRYNTVAVDYVLYPHEVFINIWESYPVVPVVIGCTLLTAGLVFGLLRMCPEMWSEGFPGKKRWSLFGCGVVAAMVLVATLSLKETKLSPDRTLNEISNNGLVALVTAAWTHNLDYAAFYQTTNHTDAYARTRELIHNPDAPFEGGTESLRRRIPGDSAKPKPNVVLLLEESLGSEFWGSLGRKEPTLTPRLDELSTEGIFFTNLYADGNRTVRGFEGILSSFPPLPGDSIVKRDRSQNVETIARVLKRDGYDTVFLYGGRGLFDGMRSFAVNNGYDRFVEQKDFPKPTFATIWGVCNEDLYNKTIEECRTLAKSGNPFFATVLSVSNHKPFTYPEGRIAEDPKARQRAHAVKYTDWALGQFFDQVKKEPFWSNTIFVVIADHGARVYGSQTIPIHSYEIPMIILGPAAVSKPVREGILGCQLDVAPTILGMIGRPYDSMFFGHDLLAAKPQPSRVVLNHNRDIGIMEEGRMVVLGLGKTIEYYKGDPKAGTMERVQTPDADHERLAADAIAIFQTADDLYMNRRYKIDEK